MLTKSSPGDYIDLYTTDLLLSAVSVSRIPNYVITTLQKRFHESRPDPREALVTIAVFCAIAISRVLFIYLSEFDEKFDSAV